MASRPPEQAVYKHLQQSGSQVPGPILPVNVNVNAPPALPKHCTHMNKKQAFLQVFPQIVQDLTETLQSYGMPTEAIQWFTKSLNYNTPGGKLNRGLSVIDTYRILTNNTELSSSQYEKVAILGWCIELLQAYFLVADDIMDHSLTRRGQPCWYKLPQVGDIAINDAFMLEGAIYHLLSKYFRQESYYIDLLDLFHEITFKTELGQLLDLITAPAQSPSSSSFPSSSLNNFSMEKHSFIVRFKTAYYSFYLPVALAMFMSGITNTKDLKQAQDVLIPLGEYFQIQDDFLDCYGSTQLIGKIGTDIQDNKCSWLINKALQLCNDDQRSILDENYGKNDPTAIENVKNVFNELNLPNHYKQYESQTYNRLNDMISNIDESRGFKRQVLSEFLNKVYKRDK